MAYERLNGILTGGAAGRSDSISGMSPEYLAVLEAMIQNAPPEIAKELRIKSAYRSPELQAKLWADELAEHGGNVAEARRWVAPPPGVHGSKGSRHGHGNAVDWSYASDKARDWVHANAANYGAVFPLSNEPWHMELAGARGGKSAPNATPGVSIATAPASAMPFAGAPSPPPVAGAVPAAAPNPIASIIAGLAGGGNKEEQQQASAAAQIAPTSIGASAGSIETAPQAAALMTALMADRRKRYGLSLVG